MAQIPSRYNQLPEVGELISELELGIEKVTPPQCKWQFMIAHTRCGENE